MTTRKHTKATILIVDDKPANILALETLLETKDRSILRASNGHDALKITLNMEVDLIILDVQMPDMDGFEVAQILRSNKRTKDIPVIFASAEKKDHKFMMKGYEEGGIDYLFKPLDPEIAKAKVSILLKIQLQKKELVEKNLSLEKSALLINNSADIIGIIDPANFRIEEINEAFTNILGYTPDETYDTPLTFFLSDEDRVMINKLKKQEKERLSFETRIYCKDRSIKWLQWNVVVRYRKWFVNARDITEIMQVEKIRNYLATVVKQSNDAIYIQDGSGQIISWNEGATQVYGYSENEATHMKVWNMIPDYEVQRTENFIGRALDGEKIQEVEMKRITKHGKIIDVLFSATVLNDAANFKTIAINERNITQQKIAEEKIRQLNAHLQNNIEQLESVNKELESFSYSVSHDLRAPLRSINSYARIILEDYGQSFTEDVTKMFESIQHNAVKMGVLIDELLTFSKLGKKMVDKHYVNMTELVDRVLQDLLRTNESQVKLHVQPLVAAEADPSLITQVWVNLIANALKYSSKKTQPVIEIGCEQSNQGPVFYVKDNGAGFDMKYIDKLFGVFQRLHGDDEFEGTGVGLAIVYRIITKHGGRVWADAKVGEGASFFFTLPESTNSESNNIA